MNILLHLLDYPAADNITKQPVFCYFGPAGKISWWFGHNQPGIRMRWAIFHICSIGMVSVTATLKYFLYRNNVEIISVNCGGGPMITEDIGNMTVALGREATLKCVVTHLSDYKVRLSVFNCLNNNRNNRKVSRWSLLQCSDHRLP